MTRTLTVAAVQPGPAAGTRDNIVDGLLRLVDQAADAGAELAVLTELSTSAYFCQTIDERNFDLAESLSGPTIARFSAKAGERACAILIGFFERDDVTGHYYNSAALIDRNGALVSGHLADGSTMPAYRKTHLSNALVNGLVSQEKYYFRPGGGLPVFDLDHTRIGLLICYDRSFPEAWRELALQGAEIILVVSATPAWREDFFVPELRTHAYEQRVFVVATNKSGLEHSVAGTRDYFGTSCVIDPFGVVQAQAQRDAQDTLVTATLDLDEVAASRVSLQIYRDRRPDIYRSLASSVWPRK